MLDERTLALADFSGNRQYISLGNLSENNKAFIFLRVSGAHLDTVSGETSLATSFGRPLSKVSTRPARGCEW